MGQFSDRMERDLLIRGYATSTRAVYLGYARDIVRFTRRSPDEMTIEDVHGYLLHSARDCNISRDTYNSRVQALRFFFNITMERGWELDLLPRQKQGRRLPEVLSPDEVRAIIAAPRHCKHRAMLMTTYACGLRVSELVKLRVSDIDSGRMMVRVDQGKGRNDRYVMLSESLLIALRNYWKQFRPSDYLFPTQGRKTPLTTRSAIRTFVKAKEKAGIKKRGGIHMLRHAFATHLLESGTNIRIIQVLLGHRSLSSTQIYTHLARNYLAETRSPLDSLSAIDGLIQSAVE